MRVAAGMPNSVTSTAKANAIGVRTLGASAGATAAQSNTVAVDAHVPGPGRNRPTPKKVPTSIAHGGVGDASATAGGRPALRS